MSASSSSMWRSEQSAERRLPNMRALLPPIGQCADVADALINPTDH